MSKCEKEKRRLSEIINQRLDIPPDVLPHESTIELRGRNCARICGCAKILIYTPTHIKLALCNSALSIVGKRLVCSSYNRSVIGVDGVIDSISFEEKEGK